MSIFHSYVELWEDPAGKSTDVGLGQMIPEMLDTIEYMGNDPLHSAR